MIGSVYDFFTLPGQVREANMRKALNDQIQRQRRMESGKPDWRYVSEAQYKVMNEKREKEHPERAILRIAKENDGILTVSDVALGADMSIDEAKKCLEALVSRGFAELRVRKTGTLVYVIPDMVDRDEPLEDF